MGEGVVFLACCINFSIWTFLRNWPAAIAWLVAAALEHKVIGIIAQC